MASSRPVGGPATLPGRRPRLDSLTGLRFFAALAVFGNHAGDVFLGDPDSVAAVVLQRGGRVGVSFFFILSGFVLTWSGSDGDGARTFYRRRIARVVPNHLTTWVIALILGVTGLAGVQTDPLLAGPSLVLLQSWFPSTDVHFAMNSVSWSISTEMFFYATFPLLLPLARRMPERSRLAVAGAVVAATALAAVIAPALVPGRAAMWLLYVFPPARLGEFVVGILIALLVIDGRWPDIGVRAATSLTVVAWFSLPVMPAGLTYVAVTLIPFSFLIAAIARRDAHGPGTWLRHPGLVRLGVWSYAFYLVHELVIRVADDNVVLLDLPPVGAAAAAAGLLGLAIGASWLLFTVVERPVERYLRGGRVAPQPAPDRSGT